MASYFNLLPLKARTVSAVSPTVTVWEKYQAAHIVVDITAGSPKLIVTVKGKDAASGKGYTLLTSAELTSGTTVLKVGPELTAGTNIAKDYLPYQFYVDVTLSGTATYSVGASLI